MQKTLLTKLPQLLVDGMRLDEANLASVIVSYLGITGFEIIFNSCELVLQNERFEAAVYFSEALERKGCNQEAFKLSCQLSSLLLANTNRFSRCLSGLGGSTAVLKMIFKLDNCDLFKELKDFFIRHCTQAIWNNLFSPSLIPFLKNHSKNFMLDIIDVFLIHIEYIPSWIRLFKFTCQLINANILDSSESQQLERSICSRIHESSLYYLLISDSEALGAFDDFLSLLLRVDDKTYFCALENELLSPKCDKYLKTLLDSIITKWINQARENGHHFLLELVRKSIAMFPPCPIIPPYSHAQLQARYQQHPSVEAFLRSNEEKFVLSGFTSITQVCNFHTLNFHTCLGPKDCPRVDVLQHYSLVWVQRPCRAFGQS